MQQHYPEHLQSACATCSSATCSSHGTQSVSAVLAPAGSAPNNTCTTDSDCTAGYECSAAATAKVCSCRGGVDSCNAASTCQPKPIEVVQAALTPCQRCTRCIASLQSNVSSVLGSGDSVTVATQMYAACSALFGDPIACRQLKQTIAYSLRGNTGKRAGGADGGGFGVQGRGPCSR